jgi:hypothetical protein
MRTDTYPGARLITADRLNCSINGNPRWLVRFETMHGDRITAKTTSDSSAGYVVDNWRAWNTTATVTTHTTKAGRVIIDYITDCTKEDAQ